MSAPHFRLLWLVCAILGSLRLAKGYQLATSGALGSCPEGHEFVNGLCYRINRCPEDYFLHTDGLCHPKHPVPCPFESTTEEPTSTTTEEPTTTTTEEPTTTTTTEEPTTTTTGETTTTTTEEPTTTTTTEESTTTTTTEEPTTTTTTEEPTTTTTTEEPTTTTTTEEPTTTTTTETTTTTTTTEEPTTTTTTTEESISETPPVAPPIIEPSPDEQVRCPPGSIFFDEQCRKIVCTEGEYYAGRCLSPACPTGTVWHGKRCQPPGYITTILEIDNVIHNRHEYTVVTENINKVEYDTLAPSQQPEVLPPGPIIETTTRRGAWYFPPIPTTQSTTTTSSTTEAYADSVPPDGCCLVKSPRICRNYAPNWVCSSRGMKLCDPRVCTQPTIYLKPPHIVESNDPPILIMPPNPPQLACSTPECKEGDILDCSGCKYNQRETCSAGCYNYYCPAGSCKFMNSEEFCALYPGGFGCNKRDGCIWNWCTEKCH